MNKKKKKELRKHPGYGPGYPYLGDVLECRKVVGDLNEEQLREIIRVMSGWDPKAVIQAAMFITERQKALQDGGATSFGDISAKGGKGSPS